MKQHVEKKIHDHMGQVSLLTVDVDGFLTWQVRGPDAFGQMMYWTQKDEAGARNFYARLVRFLYHPRPTMPPQVRP